MSEDSRLPAKFMATIRKTNIKMQEMTCCLLFPPTFYGNKKIDDVPLDFHQAGLPENT